MQIKLIYIVNFSVSGNSGKNKATREKASALKSLVGDDNFLFIHGNQNTSFINKIFNKLTFDFKVFFNLFLKRGDFIIVQRVIFLPLTYMLLKLKGVKIVSEFHADFKEEIPLLNKSNFEKIILNFVAIFYNLNFKLSDGIIFNHPYLKEKFDPIFRKPSIYSYNGANFEEFIPQDLNGAREQLNIPNDRTVFLFLGSVYQWHGVDLLIDIFNEQSICDKKDMYLYIVGANDNPYVRSLKLKAKNKNVLFITPVDAISAANYINASNICLLPVKHIRTSPGSPLKLYDYISCGKAIITQETLAGYADEVLNYNLGYVTDFTNSKNAALDVLKIMETADLKYFEEHNRDIAVTTVSWSKRMQNWLQFIKSL